jgi:hypothetical protein
MLASDFINCGGGLCDGNLACSNFSVHGMLFIELLSPSSITISLITFGMQALARGRARLKPDRVADEGL